MVTLRVILYHPLLLVAHQLTLTAHLRLFVLFFFPFFLTILPKTQQAISERDDDIFNELIERLTLMIERVAEWNESINVSKLLVPIVRKKLEDASSVLRICCEPLDIDKQSVVPALCVIEKSEDRVRIASEDIAESISIFNRMDTCLRHIKLCAHTVHVQRLSSLINALDFHFKSRPVSKPDIQFLMNFFSN